ncbi:hypothetical protein ACQP2E_20780 [Actinoplanes sp. CA-015351]|uniref:hypothetical protein n=1 Tax=Actinoplanes sp. CA-015351 TaxID=3239897 RepID=UPI003D975624
MSYFDFIVNLLTAAGVEAKANENRLVGELDGAVPHSEITIMNAVAVVERDAPVTGSIAWPIGLVQAEGLFRHQSSSGL